MHADLEALQIRLSHKFRNPELLVRALTHKSYASERLGAEALLKSPASDNEQLEFFGDSILGFLVSEALYRHFPDYPEGRLSKLKSWLVSASHLHTVAEALELGGVLLLGRGEEMSGGRTKKAILSNAVEALLAAVYLDGGIEQGMASARHFVRTLILPSEPDLESGLPAALTDFKSALQERAQALKLPQPKYLIVAERGPEHAKTFTVEVRVGKGFAARADGVSKKDAGQRAAELMIDQLESSAPAAV